MPDHTPYQQQVIRRYYRNRRALAAQRLGQIVSDIYLTDSPRKLAQLWKRVETELAALDRYRDWCRRVVASRDPARLAELVAELTKAD